MRRADHYVGRRAIKEKGLSADKVYDRAGGECHHTSTPHKSRNKMKRKKKNKKQNLYQIMINKILLNTINCLKKIIVTIMK